MQEANKALNGPTKLVFHTSGYSLGPASIKINAIVTQYLKFLKMVPSNVFENFLMKSSNDEIGKENIDEMGKR